MQLVTVLGGTGVFGRRIAAEFASRKGTRVRVAGRSERSAAQAGESANIEFHAADIADRASLRRAIEGSTIVIHAAGPFQGRDYQVAEACIDAGCHYMDIADARDFVCGITALDKAARARGVFVTSGASSVPAITCAMVRDLQPQFRAIEEIQIALSPGNQNPRGASTIAAILSYLGRPIQVWQDGRWVTRRGWGDARRLRFPHPVGCRRVHNCDVPDLELFPQMFGARTVRFFAGVELDLLNYILSMMAGARRIVAMPNLHRAAPLFLRGSLLLYRFGSKNGALGAWVRGTGQDGSFIERRTAIVTDDDGPATPCSPSILLARKILDDGPPTIGATPCMGFITLDELEQHLRRFGVRVVRDK